MVLLIKAQGTHAEIGEQEGTQLRAHIRAKIDEMFHSEVMETLKPRLVPVVVLKWGLGVLAKHHIAKPIQQYLPRQLAKMRGMARGTGLSMSLIYGTQFIEIFSGNPKSTFKNLPIQACSQLFALPEVTADGSQFFARNNDFPNILQPIQLLREETPTDGLRTLTMSYLTMAGAHIGLNERGLAIGEDYGRAWRTRPLDYRLSGVPGLLLLQEALETCETTEEVIRFVTNFPARANGFHFGVLDASGDACVIETTATRSAIRHPEGGILAQTNHYLSPELADANLPEEVTWQFKGMQVPYMKSPRERYEREIQMLEDARGSITIDTLKAILRDHRGGEGSDFTPCTHSEVASTLASIIINPLTRQMWVTDMQPCLMEYEEFQLG
jgi:hypothetical protein